LDDRAAEGGVEAGVGGAAEGVVEPAGAEAEGEPAGEGERQLSVDVPAEIGRRPGGGPESAHVAADLDGEPGGEAELGAGADVGVVERAVHGAVERVAVDAELQRADAQAAEGVEAQPAERGLVRVGRNDGVERAQLADETAEKAC